MAYFVPFVLIVLQITTSLALHPLPLKCLLHEPIFMGIFNQSSADPRYMFPKKTPFTFDALNIDSVSFQQDDFIFEAKDMVVRGLQDAALEGIELNFEGNELRLNMRLDVFATSRYKARGALFFLPIEGDGSFTLFLKNVQLYLVMPFNTKDANGNKSIDLKNYSFWYDVRDKAEFKFTNLYNGNQELSDTMHNVINQNWKLLTVIFGKHTFNTAVSYLFNETQKYMSAMPLKDYTKC